MSDLILIISLFWLPSLMVIWRNILWDLYLWQVKEYRFDRMISHILSQEEDSKQSTIVYAFKVGFLLLLLLYLFFPTSDILLFAIPATFAIYIFEALKTTQETIGKKLVRPKISVRNIIILFFTLTIAMLPYAIVLFPTIEIQKSYQDLSLISDIAKELSESVHLVPITPEGSDIKVYPAATLALLFSSIFVLMLDLVTPLLISFFVFLTEPIAQIRRYMIISSAKNKVRSNKNLKVVGITGSYGKTTTKEVLYQILSKKYKTIKTPKNYNSAVGVALAVNQFIKNDTEVFIAEMGAYTKNEVKDATEIAKPDVAIVTGIDSQHITLFGSIENIIKAKYEIISNAKENATAILNGDNEFCLRMAEMTDKNKVLYFTSRDKNKVLSTGTVIRVEKDEFPIEHTLFAYDIKRRENGIEFKMKQEKETYTIKTNINGPHNVSNILAAMGACLILGMEMDEIIKLINESELEVPYLNRMNGLNSTTILDDGYNANATGFHAALDELASINNDTMKHVFTKGIIELGWEKAKVYDQISRKLITVANTLVTSDRVLHQSVKRIKPSFNSILVKGTDSFMKEFMRNTNKGDIVLIEGPMNPRFLADIIDKD